ncbi:MAG TPA: hypothetical protein VIF88_11290 [Methylocystis sp.]|jgi:hypothetical protein
MKTRISRRARAAAPATLDGGSNNASPLASLLAAWLSLCEACDAAGPDVPYELRSTRCDLETRIIETPARNIAELLLKGRVVKRWFDARETAAVWAGRLLADDAARLAAS